jgi:hypothetical protein
VVLTPRSIATVFGDHLADGTATAVPPWPKTLRNIELHIVINPVHYQCSVCEEAADMIYASPTQINFVVPGDMDGVLARIVLIKNGVRYDSHDDVFGGSGLIGIDSNYGDRAIVFGVGYDCLFSLSVTDPSACGLAWFQGLHRALLGAVTDAASGQLITRQNPVHQGQLITLWLTGLPGLRRDPGTGLLQLANPGLATFGVAQYGSDKKVEPLVTPPALWAGESPQFVGLDQVNVNFPVCVARAAITEKRYDAFFAYRNSVRIYLPFVISPGEPDCWTNTTTSIASNPNPSTQGQSVTFTATVAPLAATGMVTFFDGTAALGSATLSGGKATLFYGLSAGRHPITAAYDGDDNWGGSTSAVLSQTVKADTSVTLTSSVNPSTVGQSLILTAIVSPPTATGIVTFFNGTSALGDATLSGGKATFAYVGSIVGTYSITASYRGDANNSGSSSPVLTQIVTPKTSTNVTVVSSLNPSVSGQSVTFTATVAPSSATGYVTFNYCGSKTTLTNGQAQCSTIITTPGTYSVTATYSGDSHYSGSSAALTQTVKANTSVTLTANPNPSTQGQSVTFKATMAQSAATGTVMFLVDGTMIGTGTLSGGTVTFATAVLVAGSHHVTAAYGGDSNYGGSTSSVLTQIVRANTTTTLTSSTNPSAPGQLVTFTATVSPSQATGTVTFFDGSSPLDSRSVQYVPLIGGQATFSTSGLSVGTHSIKATYSGDSYNYTSISVILAQIVGYP